MAVEMFVKQVTEISRDVFDQFTSSNGQKSSCERAGGDDVLFLSFITSRNYLLDIPGDE